MWCQNIQAKTAKNEPENTYVLPTTDSRLMGLYLKPSLLARLNDFLQKERHHLREPILDQSSKDTGLRKHSAMYLLMIALVLSASMFTLESCTSKLSKPAEDDAPLYSEPRGTIECFPPIMGLHYGFGSSGDELFAQGNLPEAIRAYQFSYDKGKKGGVNPAFLVDILARKAWALCLLSRFEDARENVKQAIALAKGDNYRLELLQFLSVRVAAESGNYSNAASELEALRKWSGQFETPIELSPITTGSIREGPGSYFACLWFSGQKQAFYNCCDNLIKELEAQRLYIPDYIWKLRSKKATESIIESLPLPETIAESKRVQEGHYKYNKITFSPVSFDERQWRSAWRTSSNYRLRAMLNLLQTRAILGQDRAHVRKLLGPPIFCKECAVYQDYFPLCSVSSPILLHNFRHRIKLGVPINESGQIWTLIAGYDENGKCVSLRDVWVWSVGYLEDPLIKRTDQPSESVR